MDTIDYNKLTPEDQWVYDRMPYLFKQAAQEKQAAKITTTTEKKEK